MCKLELVHLKVQPTRLATDQSLEETVSYASASAPNRVPFGLMNK